MVFFTFLGSDLPPESVIESVGSTCGRALRSLGEIGRQGLDGRSIGICPTKKKKTCWGVGFLGVQYWMYYIYMYNIIVSLYNSCWDIYYPVHSDLNMYTSQIIIFLVESLTKKKQHRQHRLTATARGPGDSGDLTKPIGMR